ncbi:exoribonuclease family protein [Clohesyomyces aquaticus]|uniref:Ribosomal RNA-processing protein 43 n=1 Tax=Clohesyomyces aquaticus TaxID=1231657 RepID=A0A1Y2A859_9PLEO|nr:exoribonuclease family protein [Clohesyomyces aquaticus]
MASANTATSTPALSFPRPIFAAISPHSFLQAHLSNPTAPNKAFRANGRSAHEFRTPGIKTGALTHCHGSAVVRVGNTSVVCGVRGEILRAEDIADPPSSTPDTGNEVHEDGGDDELDSLRLLVPNLELNTGSTPSNIPGSAPSSTAQTLITRIRSLLLSTRILRARDLRIVYTPPPATPDEVPDRQVKAYWTLYVDIMFISLDGNAFDSAWLAVLAALRDTRLPKAFFDQEMETILCSDIPSEAAPLKLRGCPVASTFAVFDGWKDGDATEGTEDWVLSDPDAFEEGVCQESVCVVVDCVGGRGSGQEQIRRIEKSGGGVVGREEMRGLVKRSVDRWTICEGVLKGVGSA